VGLVAQRLGSAMASWLLSILPGIESGAAGAMDVAAAAFSFAFVSNAAGRSVPQPWDFQAKKTV
jgi:hypothetical protein